MPKIINVYFNGTDDSNTVPVVGDITLAALLHELTLNDNRENYSLCVNGCGVESTDPRDLGGIFTFHLEKQVDKISSQIKQVVNQATDKVTLNIYGFSRGGAAALLLCQKLKNISQEKLSINVVAFEPVPGNSILAVYGDIFLKTNTTLSSAVADLTQCKNISNALVLFTNRPIPAIACHAPILPTFPATCRYDADVTPGCHKSAVSFSKGLNKISPNNTESLIVLHRVIEFLKNNGTRFDFTKLKFNYGLSFEDAAEIMNEKIVRFYDELVKKHSLMYPSYRRSMHLFNHISTDTSRLLFLNRYHQALTAGAAIDDRHCLLSIQNRNPERVNTEVSYAGRIMQLVLMLAMFWIIYNRYLKTPSSELNHFRPGF